MDLGKEEMEYVQLHIQLPKTLYEKLIKVLKTQGYVKKNKAAITEWIKHEARETIKMAGVW